MIIQENVSLAPLTTFKVGGLARFFAVVRSVEELHGVLATARQNSWQILILADGSNLIISDDDFNGLVISIDINSWRLDGTTLTSGASTSMKELVDTSVEAGYSGLEWAGGLPGSFGGAIRGNAGCFGGEIKDSIVEVESVESVTLKKIVRSQDDCKFGYRDSIFKISSEVIIGAKLRLEPGDRVELRRIADDHIHYRQTHHPMKYPNSGSIFKNVPLEQVPKVHLPLFKDAIKNDPFPLVPTAKIIAVAGLKGWRVGDAQLSEKHSNYIVNLGQAKAADIVTLIEKIKTEIKSRYQIELEVEPQLVGFD